MDKKDMIEAYYISRKLSGSKGKDKEKLIKKLEELKKKPIKK